MFKWLKRLLPAYKAEGLWSVALTADEIITTDGNGTPRRMPIADLRRVVIVTNDSGPAGDDVLYFLLGESDEPIACFPIGSDGEQAFVEWLVKQSGSKEQGIIDAMGSTKNARFIAYERP